MFVAGCITVIALKQRVFFQLLLDEFCQLNIR